MRLLSTVSATMFVSVLLSVSVVVPSVSARMTAAQTDAHYARQPTTCVTKDDYGKSVPPSCIVSLALGNSTGTEYPNLAACQAAGCGANTVPITPWWAVLPLVGACGFVLYRSKLIPDFRPAA
jgi:hypothetical protein